MTTRQEAFPSMPLGTTLNTSTGPTRKSFSKVFNQHFKAVLTHDFATVMGHDVHVVLSPDDVYEEGVEEKDLYEIVIGGWGNSKSVIRRGHQGDELDSAQTPSIISGFWISTRKNTEHSLEIMVGKIGQALPLMLAVDPEPVDIQYLGLASWTNTNAFYRNVRTGKGRDKCMKLTVMFRSWSVPNFSYTKSKTGKICSLDVNSKD